MEALITFIMQTRASTDTYTWTKMCPSNKICPIYQKYIIIMKQWAPSVRGLSWISVISL